LVLSLDKDKNEMRGFRFFDCGNKRCIFGKRFGKLHDITGLNPTPDLDLSLVLWPGEKQILISNPCHDRQITNYELEQLGTNKFMIVVDCVSYELYGLPRYYKGEFKIEKR
jgi:hypothetical protein